MEIWNPVREETHVRYLRFLEQNSKRQARGHMVSTQDRPSCHSTPEKADRPAPGSARSELSTCARIQEFTSNNNQLQKPKVNQP
jgi:hypothetical protein